MGQIDYVEILLAKPAPNLAIGRMLAAKPAKRAKAVMEHLPNLIGASNPCILPRKCLPLYLPQLL